MIQCGVLGKRVRRLGGSDSGNGGKCDNTNIWKRKILLTFDFHCLNGLILTCEKQNNNGSFVTGCHHVCAQALPKLNNSNKLTLIID